MLLTGNPDYVAVFAKHLADPESGYQTFTNSERQAWARVKEYQRAALGMSGAVLPSPLDPAIVLTNAGALDPMRRLARIDQTTSNSKRYVTAAGVTATFDAELTETSDDTTPLVEVEIDVEKAQAFVQASIEAAMDQPDFASIEVPRLMADAKARLEADKFVNGTGTNEPYGIWTQLGGTASELSPATVEVFAAADVYTTAEGLPAAWQSNAAFQAELSTLNATD